ncbi:Glutamate--tRNA ligase 2 [Heracleum sosnowskyi]|uniref:Glutamate--tRNA ligase 2 n=1 Tax=Heracleum sosnowskyi TaxID=360622 RepID=A0AAD8MMF3_9APIA|nr:Glutamate--tRNA ligase 2 [Heracleum sosnowskyi]
MTQVVLNLRPPLLTPTLLASSPVLSPPNRVKTPTRYPDSTRKWALLQYSHKCTARFSCFFSHNGSKQEQARKALESALGGKKTEFEKWNKEIKRRESAGGGNSGGGGWFRWFGGSNDDDSWQEAQQISLTIFGIVAMYMLIAKGDVMLAVFFNALLTAIRATKNSFTFVTMKILKTVSPSTLAKLESLPKEEVSAPVSAKESVLRKWAS